MAGQDEVSLKVRVELTNQQKAISDLTTAFKDGLIDASEKALHTMRARTKTAEAQLNAGEIDDAIKTLRGNNNALLRYYEQVNVNAGGAASNLAKLSAELSRLENLTRNIEKTNPEKTFRYNEKTGEYHYLKSAVNRAAIGFPNREGIATLQNGNQSIKLDYGGRNWSLTNASYSITRALNTGKIQQDEKTINVTSPGWIKKFEEALTALGYKLQQIAGGKYEAVLDSDRLEKEAKEAERNYKNDLEQIAIKRAEIEEEIKAEKLVVDSVTVEGDDGKSFNTGKGTDAAIKSNQNLAAAQEELTDQEKAAAKAAQDLENKQDSLTKSMDGQRNAVGRAVTTFFSYQLILRQVRRLWNDALNTIRELDTQLTNQAIVTDLTRESAWGLVQTYQELGRATGFTTTQIAAVNTEYLRQGNSLKDALVLTEAAAKAAQVAGITATDSVRYLTTAIHGFRLEAEDALAVSDKFAALAADSASDYEDLAIALSKVASQASLAGMSMDYTLALLTTGLDITQEAPESIGTALKTVIARMREISDYGETLIDGTDINQVEAALKYVNVELRNSSGELRSTEEVLDELGRKWDTLSANQQATVAKALAGTRQQSRLVAILDNYQDVIKYQEEAQLSVGATNAQMQEYLEGMDAAMNRLHVAYEAFITNITNNNLIVGVVNFLASTLDKVAKWFENASGQATVILGLLGIFASRLIPKIAGGVAGLLQAAKDREKTEERISKIYTEQYNKMMQIRGAEKPSSGSGESGSSNNGINTSAGLTKATQWGSAAIQIAAAIAGLAAMIKSIVDDAQNFPKKMAEQAIEEGQRIQGEIYNNRKTKNALESLTSSFDELNKKVIKTADDLDKMSKTREELISALAGDGSTLIYENMSTQALIDASEARQRDLDAENEKLIDELSETLLGASYQFNWDTVGNRVTAGAGIGAMAGMGIGTPIAGIGAGLGGLIGGVIGASAGLYTGIIEELARTLDAKKQQKKIHELLQTAEGVEQIQTLLAYQYRDAIDTTTMAGQELSDAIKSTYSTLISSLSGEQLETLLKKYNYNSEKLKDAIVEATQSAGAAITALSDSDSTYANRIKAVQRLYAAYLRIDTEMAENFKRQYQTYFDIYESIGEVGVKYLDLLSLNLNDTNDLLAALQDMQNSGVIESVTDAFYDLMQVLADPNHTVKDLTNITDNWSYKAVQAASRLVASGNTLDSVAAEMTSVNSSISGVRETQTKWGSMSAIDQQNWLQSNMMFFLDENGNFDQKAWEDFINGVDITEYIERYKRNAKEALEKGSASIYESAIMGLSKAVSDLEDKRLELASIADTDSDEYKQLAQEIADLESSIADYNGQIAMSEYLMERAAHIGELSLSDIVDRQSRQIEAMKRMYQAQEEALTKSLEKRRDAYEKYFDSIEKAEAMTEYVESRNQLISSISRLGGGADAASRARVNELRKQLVQLEKDQAQQKREDARQAVLDNIDSQIDKISEHFKELLNNNQKMLESMDENTHMQYLMYLAQSGMTVEEQEIAKNELADLLQGRWGINGLEPFAATTIPQVDSVETNTSTNTTSLTINGQSETLTLTDADVKALMTTVLNKLTQLTGRSFKV